MKQLKQFPTTDYQKFPQRYYFLSIIKNIIKIADLKNTQMTILDFGCGQKIISKKLQDKKVLNYDKKNEYSDYDNYESLKFDIVIFNHVLMYLKVNEINELLDKFKQINPRCKFILSLGKQNFLSKIAMFLALNFNAHEDTMSTYKEQIDIFFNKTKLIKKKTNIFFMTDIYYFKF